MEGMLSLFMQENNRNALSKVPTQCTRGESYTGFLLFCDLLPHAAARSCHQVAHIDILAESSGCCRWMHIAGKLGRWSRFAGKSLA